MRILFILLALITAGCAGAPAIDVPPATSIETKAITVPELPTSVPAPTLPQIIAPDEMQTCILDYPGSQETIGLLTNPYDDTELHTTHIRRGAECKIIEYLSGVGFLLDERRETDVFYATCFSYKVYIYTDYYQ